jgi:hypothetical protein
MKKIKKTTKKNTLPSCAHPLDKRESRRPAMTIDEVFRSRGLEGSYSIEEITAYVESLKSPGGYLRNTLLDEVIHEFWNSDIPF